MRTKSLLLLANLCFFILPIQAQEPLKHCGTDEMHQQLFQQYPQYNAGIERANQRLQKFTTEYAKLPSNKSGALYVIPVVFHIIHNYGDENISDAQIHDAMKQLNMQYRKLNADTTDIVTAFKPLAADIEVEFRLAQLDPYGNCTSGITRTVSPLTAIGDHQVKSLIHWPSDSYLNVYVCAEAAGLAGHALLPSAADTIPQWDGIVMQHDYVGTIGTSDYFRRTVLSHEVGHYLNLQHIWGGNNVPNYYYLPVGDAGNCAFDDDVMDTPNTLGWQTCNLNGYTCGSLDNVQNYMDYSYCALMFTEGQKTRMHACLNSTVANRNNLWSPANRIATGTDDVTYYLCQAKFETEKRIACVGEAITLTDVSTHGVQSRTWTIPGATLSSTTDSVITATFSTPGTYDVTLNVSSGAQNLDHTEVAYITILPSTGSMNVLHEHFEVAQDFEDHWNVVPKDAPNNWERTTLAAYNSGSSITVQNHGVGAESSYEFISEPFDASGLPAIALWFDFAYAQRQTTDIEQLQVSISTDCGASWLIKKNYYGSTSLKTVDTLVTSSFIPVDSTQWKHDVISNITSASLTNDLLFKFKFDAKAGNNIYIDNIRIGNPAILGLDVLSALELTVYPNPATDKITLDLPEGLNVLSASFLDVTGKFISTEAMNDSLTTEFSIDHLSTGMYTLHLSTSIGEKYVRFIKE